ncbi:hypothetical protein CAPGI0001_0322 [Capnocytophaga gingivalis ATCC 33624]|nr:hypothetical protein CAPGI0001_0322 [Capnocytophaga gingivalis ATCC 33624]
MHPLGAEMNFPKGRKIVPLTILFKASFRNPSFAGYHS